MEKDGDHVEVLEPFRSLLRILHRLTESLGAERRYIKQAAVLGGLSAYLYIVQDGKLSPEIERELELICTWPKPLIKNSKQLPTLKALSAAKYTSRYSDACEAVSAGLQAFAFATPREREACEELAKAQTSAHVEGADSRVARPAKHSVMPEDYPNFVNATLYDTLRKYTRCRCEVAGEAISIEHEARLCLRSRVHIDQGLINFDLHFCSLPYWDLEKQESYWQQLRLHVPSKRSKIKRVRVHDTEPSKSVAPLESTTYSPFHGGAESIQLDDDANVPIDEFCSLLNGQNIGPAKVRLKVQENSLLRIHEVDETDQELIDRPSVSLAQVLHQHCLSTKMKMSLAYTLARSVWQYYASDWMGSGWTCKTIHFMLEKFTNPKPSIIDASKPCLTVQFQSTSDTIPERYEIPQVVHKYPRVVALGMLLIDIARTSHAESIASVAQTQQQKANTDYMTGRKIIERDHSWPDLGTADAARQRLRTVYKTATQNCFDKHIFGETLSSASSKSPRDETEEHRKILYDRVVWPLEKIIIDMGWSDSLHESVTIKVDESITHTSKLPHRPSSALRKQISSTRSVSTRSVPLQRQESLTGTNAALFDDMMPFDGHNSERLVRKILVQPFVTHETGTSASNSSRLSRKAYVDWKTGFIQVYRHFIPERLPESVLPVKIAILDTGLDMDHECIEASAERIQGEDWLSEPRSGTFHDSHGHGTHIAGIILDFIPHCELYVAKVTDGDATDPETVARAIDYLVDQRFDIVSLSIGFPQKVLGYDALERAIEKAYSARVLIFAAASNGGGNNDRAYPARERHVFCIHSTDAKGTRSRFSPTAEEHAFNFATIGEAVESFWPRDLCQPDEDATKVKSGTSFATPIAAGIAAFLLLYARMKFGPERADRLKRHTSMEWLLYELSRSSRPKKDRDDYQYILLSRHPDNLFGRDPEEIDKIFLKHTT